MAPKRYRKILIIRINHANAGFFAYLTFVINQLRVCEQNDFLPIVFFGAQSGGGKNAYYDASYGSNMWDYYFEPVAELSIDQLLQKINSSDSEITNEHLITLTDQQLWQLHAGNPESTFNYPYGVYKDIKKSELAQWYERQRSQAAYYINKYIRIKPHIVEKVDQFHAQYLAGKNVLGVHMRGSDKGTADSSAELMKIIRPQQYYPYIDNYLGDHPGSKIFLATEQTQFVAEMQSHYGDKLVVREVIRTDGFGHGNNPFQKRSEGMGYQKGEDVLIDCLLLSRSNFLLKCVSAVGEYAMYFNRALRCIDLNHEMASN